MNNDLLHTAAPFDADFGWSQMRVLLDEQLPVKSPPRKQKVGWSQRGFALLSMLLILSLQLNVGLQEPALKFDQASTMLAKASPILKPNKLKLANSKIKAQLTQHSPVGQGSIGQSFGGSFEYAPGNDDNSSVQKIPMDVSALESYKPFVSSRIKQPFLPTIIQEKLINSKQQRTWQINVGLAQNFQLHAAQKLLPTPFVAITYEVNPRLYISGAVQPYSPIINKASGTSKSGMVNDPQNTISQYDEKTSFTNIAYTDVPVFAGVKLTKNLAIQAGMQASFLVAKSRKTATVFYDNQRNPLPVIGNPPVTTAAAPTPEIHEIDVRKVDVRFVGGVNYSFGKTALSVDYQHGLRTLLRGRQVSPEKNHLLSVKFQVKLR